MKRIFYILCCAVIVAGCQGQTGVQSQEGDSCKSELREGGNATTDGTCDKRAYTTRTEKGDLIIYVPHYSTMDLVCGTMPTKADCSVIFCAEAAFTGELLNEFKHTNIAGDHVSGGVRYKGFKCKRNTGCFVFYNGVYKFLYRDTDGELDKAAKNGGMGFGQETIIHKGKRVEGKRKDTNKNEFRALCELNHQLCIIDSKGVVEYGKFANDLLAIGVTEALYLDMGSGWNYSWWRNATGKACNIHNLRIAYTTNWITFYK